MSTITNLNTTFKTHTVPKAKQFAIVAEHDLECTKPQNTYLYAVAVVNLKKNSCKVHDFLLNKPMEEYASIDELKEAISHSTVYFADERQALRELVLTRTVRTIATLV